MDVQTYHLNHDWRSLFPLRIKSETKQMESVSNSPLPRDRELESRTHTDRASIDVGVVKSRLRNVGDMSGELCVCKLTAESSVIVTTVRVTIGYSDSFLLPKKDLTILKIFGYW